LWGGGTLGGAGDCKQSHHLGTGWVAESILSAGWPWRRLLAGSAKGEIRSEDGGFEKMKGIWNDNRVPEAAYWTYRLRGGGG
jgi:hypothetical protein